RRHAARVARLFSPLSHADLEGLVRLLDRIREPLRGSEVARMRGSRLSQPKSKESRAARPTRRRARSKSGGDG
ncbi:MAG TPA: MarR family transcriptional regulator, partial [Polyangiaceae bacterium]|nr:MarR family transcriptional regulator [Polyangiaceae bacterium]